MNCELIEVKLTHTLSRYYCPLCERHFDGSPGFRHAKRTCSKPQGPCAHLGAERRRVQCQSCGGNVQVKVFACAVHGECTLSKDVGVKVCPCPDYKPLPADQS